MERQPSHDRFGRYRVTDRLGSGAAGIVFRAVDTETGEPVAVKTLQLRDPTELESLRREIYSLSRVRSDGIVRILRQGVLDGLPWYAMELIEGDTIDVLWRDRPPPHDAARGGFTRLHPALRAIRQLCHTLAFLHGEGIVHRDLKPGNVVLRPDGLPVLVDFGLAARFEAPGGRETLEVGGKTIGTLAYMAPEQARGEFVDARADLYSIGCILYEAVAGRPPFVGPAWTVLEQKLRSTPEPPSRHASVVPPKLDELVLRLLTKEPAERIGYAVDVAAQLNGVLNESPEVAGASSTMYLYRPRFSGRREQVARIASAVAGLRAGAGDVILVSGESGVGKTRFAMEVTRTATQRGALVIGGQCVALETAIDAAQAQGGPLHPLIPLLRYLADYCRSKGPDTTKTVLGRRAKTLAAYEPSLGELPGTEEYPDPPPMPAGAARARLVGDLADTLVAFAGRERMVLVLDDLQWADELTLHVLASLPTAFFQQAPLLVIGCYRSEECGAALAKVIAAHGDVLQLGRLDDGDLARIASDMLALKEPPPVLTRFLGQHSEGNPFFVSEYLRMVVEERHLERSSAGEWHIPEIEGVAPEAYDHLPIPRTVYALVQRRLDTLGEQGRCVLQMAAVLGREFHAGLVQEATLLNDGQQLEATAELVARHILEAGPGDQLRFTHDKLREVTYDGLASGERRDLHRRAAEAIESRHGNGPEIVSWYPSLALHWSNGEDHARAADYYARAGEIALRSGASGDARTLLDRALDSDRRSPTKVSRLLRGRWIRQIGEAAYGVGDIPGAIANSSEALTALGFMPPRGAVGSLVSILAAVPQTLRRPADAGTITDDVAHEGALAAGQASQAYHLTTRFLEGLACGVRCVALARRSGSPVTAAQALAQIGYLWGTVRLPGLARRCFEQARALREHVDPNLFGGCLYFEAMSETGLAHWERSQMLGEQSLALLQSIGNRQEAETALTIIASALFYAGKFEAAAECCGRLLESARARGNTHHTAWGLFLGGRSVVALGRLHEGIEMLEKGRALMQPIDDRLSSIMCEGSLARALLYAGELAKAAEVRDSLEARLSSLWVVPLAHCFDGVGALPEVTMGLAVRSGDLGLLRKAGRACFALDRFALMFPLARPTALRCKGELLWMRGRRARALRVWQRSITAATRLHMPYEAARGHQALSLHAPSLAARAFHGERARVLFSELGCCYHLEQMRQANPVDGGARAAF